MRHMKIAYRILISVILLLIPITSYAYNGDTIVHITSTGSKYHTSVCGYLKSDIEITLSDAVSKGYSPCSRCNPPVLTNDYDFTSQRSAGISSTDHAKSDDKTYKTTPAPKSTPIPKQRNVPENKNIQSKNNNAGEDNDYKKYIIGICLFLLGYSIASIRYVTFGNYEKKKLLTNESPKITPLKTQKNLKKENSYNPKEVQFSNIREYNTYIHYFNLYAFYKPEDFVNIPKGVYFRDGIPIAPGKGTFGLYTVYTTKNGNRYHQSKGCANSNTIEKTHIMYTRYMRPCSKCVKKEIPDIKWYNEYKKIRNIKRSYNIP